MENRDNPFSFLNARDYIIESEEIPDEKHEGVYVVRATDKKTLSTCPVCGGPVKKNRKGGKKVFDVSFRHHGCLLRIDLKRQRYKCEHCDITMLAETENNHVLHSLPTGKCLYTTGFRMFCVSRLAEADATIQGVSEKYGISKGIVSKLANELSCTTDTTGYLEKQFFHTLYLCPFHYQKKDRYFLAGTTEKDEDFILKFFGFENARKEMEEYFSQNAEFNRIFTDVNVDLVSFLEKTNDDAYISFVPARFKGYLDALCNKFRDEKYDAMERKSTELLGYLKIKDLKGRMEKIRGWNAETGGDPFLRKSFETIRKLIDEHEYAFECYEPGNKHYKYINEKWQFISDCNRRKISFKLLMVKILYEQIERIWNTPQGNVAGYLNSIEWLVKGNE